MLNPRVILRHVEKATPLERLPGESFRSVQDRLARSSNFDSFGALFKAARLEKLEAIKRVRIFSEIALEKIKCVFPELSFISVSSSKCSYPLFKVSYNGSPVLFVVFCEDDITNPHCIYLDKTEHIPDYCTQDVRLVGFSPGHSRSSEGRPLYVTIMLMTLMEALGRDINYMLSPTPVLQKFGEIMKANPSSLHPYGYLFFGESTLDDLHRYGFTFCWKREGRYLQGMLNVELSEGKNLFVKQNVLSTGREGFDLLLLKHLTLESFSSKKHQLPSKGWLSASEIEDLFWKFRGDNPKKWRWLGYENGMKEYVQPSVEPIVARVEKKKWLWGEGIASNSFSYMQSVLRFSSKMANT